MPTRCRRERVVGPRRSATASSKRRRQFERSGRQSSTVMAGAAARRAGAVPWHGASGYAIVVASRFGPGPPLAIGLAAI
jgi:hypothetical protein